MNLLQITGDAVVTEVHDCEGRCNIALHLEIFNPSPTDSVQIADHRRYYLSPGGWVEQGPWDSPDFYGMGPTVGPGVRRTYDTVSPWEVGLASHLLLDIEVISGARRENVIVQIPFVMVPSTRWTQFPATVSPPPAPPGRPDPLPFEHGRYPIFLQEPVDVFPVMEGDQAWLVLTGQLANPWRTTMRLDALDYVLEASDGNRLTGTLPLRLRTDQTDTAGNLIWVNFASQASSAGMFSFNHAITVPAPTTARWRWVTLTASAGARGVFTRRAAIATDTRPLHALRYPVDDLPGGSWSAWNAPAHDDFTLHNADQSERYALDLVAEKAGQTMKNPAGRDDDNHNFWSYGVPVRAMDDGVVVYVLSTVPDGLGHHGYSLPAPGGGAWPADRPAGGNVVVLQHDDHHYSLYAHLSPTSAFPAVGARVSAGTQLGSLGNSGNSSEPHLHVAYWTFDPVTGGHRALPIAFSNVATSAGAPLPGVIAGDNHVHVSAPAPPAYMVAVPDCLDSPEARARQLVVAAGLVVGRVTTSPSSPVNLPPSHVFVVVDQRPRAGTMAPTGSVVDLTIQRDG